MTEKRGGGACLSPFFSFSRLVATQQEGGSKTDERDRMTIVKEPGGRGCKTVQNVTLPGTSDH